MNMYRTRNSTNASNTRIPMTRPMIMPGLGFEVVVFGSFAATCELEMEIVLAVSQGCR